MPQPCQATTSFTASLTLFYQILFLCLLYCFPPGCCFLHIVALTQLYTIRADDITASNVGRNVQMVSLGGVGRVLQRPRNQDSLNSFSSSSSNATAAFMCGVTLYSSGQAFTDTTKHRRECFQGLKRRILALRSDARCR